MMMIIVVKILIMMMIRFKEVLDTFASIIIVSEKSRSLAEMITMATAASQILTIKHLLLPNLTTTSALSMRLVVTLTINYIRYVFLPKYKPNN